jgi:hypothetical protein
MPFSRSSRAVRGAVTCLALLVATATSADAQQRARVLGSESLISRTEATLRLELADGRRMQLSLRNNEAFVDGTRIGSAPRGGELDRSWRELVTRATDAPAAELPQLLTSWEAPGGDVGTRLSRSITEALMPVVAEAVPAEAPAASGAPGVAPFSDSVVRLVERIGELESVRAELESVRAELESVRVDRRSARSSRGNPFRHITEGIAGVFSIMIAYAVLFGIGFLVILFGGRRYIEGVADTARHAPGRSLLVGLAASFLVIPAFILGLLALIISIVGIPAILIWIPAFPLAVLGAAVLGYIGIAHAAGEAFAERRFYVTDWFQRGNSYYFLLSGFGLLLAFFLASQVVHMAGPWLNFIGNILIFFGVVTTVVSIAVGFGAVLISRAGTRSSRPAPAMEEQDLFREEAGV